MKSPEDLLLPTGWKHRLLAIAIRVARRLPKGKSTAFMACHRLLRAPRRIVAQLGGKPFVTDTWDRHTALITALLGIYEPPATAVFLRLLKEGARVMDVGANKGYFSLIAAARIGPSGAVVAYEPLEDNAGDIEASAKLGGLTHLSVRRVAISSSCGEVSFRDSEWDEGHSGWGAVAKGGALRLPCSTIDAEMATLGWDHIDVLKLDIEGHEYEVLPAIAPLLVSGKIGSALLELHTSAAKPGDLERVADIFSSAGFQLWRIGDPSKPISDLAAAESLPVSSILEPFDAADPRPVDLRVHVLAAKASPDIDTFPFRT